MVAGLYGMIVEALGSRLYLIGYLPYLAETKLRDPRAAIDVGWIEDQVVDQRLSGVSQSISDHSCRKHSS
jgi:hypothetical protein